MSNCGNGCVCSQKFSNLASGLPSVFITVPSTPAVVLEANSCTRLTPDQRQSHSFPCPPGTAGSHVDRVSFSENAAKNSLLSIEPEKATSIAVNSSLSEEKQSTQTSENTFATRSRASPIPQKTRSPPFTCLSGRSFSAKDIATTQGLFHRIIVQRGQRRCHSCSSGKKFSGGHQAKCLCGARASRAASAECGSSKIPGTFSTRTKHGKPSFTECQSCGRRISRAGHGFVQQVPVKVVCTRCQVDKAEEP